MPHGRGAIASRVEDKVSRQLFILFCLAFISRADRRVVQQRLRCLLFLLGRFIAGWGPEEQACLIDNKNAV
jgi:hypothetical protein